MVIFGEHNCLLFSLETLPVYLLSLENLSVYYYISGNKLFMTIFREPAYLLLSLENMSVHYLRRTILFILILIEQT